MHRRQITWPWAEADDKIIAEMAAAKKSAASIAARVGRTAVSVRRRAAKLGVKLETITEARK